MTMTLPQRGKFLLLLQLAAAGVFFGRAWQHIFWDAPYRAVLWDERWMRGPVEFLLGVSWSEFLTNPATDRYIQGFIQLVGLVLLLAGIAALAIRLFPLVSRFFLVVGGVLLIMLSLLYAKEKFWSIAQFFEYSLQMSSPFLLLYYFRSGTLDEPMEWWLKIAIALTFTCHGLFAVNFYPRPAYFTEMTMNILGVSESGAFLFLKLAGMLDILVSIWIFLPGRWGQLALGYAVFWGTATTLARVWAYFHPEFWLSSLHQWMHESIMRAPHFLLPLFLLMVLLERYRERVMIGGNALG